MEPAHADLPLYRRAVARDGSHDHKERQIVSHAALKVRSERQPGIETCHHSSPLFLILDFSQARTLRRASSNSRS